MNHAGRVFEKWWELWKNVLEERTKKEVGKEAFSHGMVIARREQADTVNELRNTLTRLRKELRDAQDAVASTESSPTEMLERVRGEISKTQKEAEQEYFGNGD